MLSAVVDDSEPGLEAVRVLLVDDDPRSLEMYCYILEQAGAVVESVPSALAAAAALERFRPDVLLSDIVMPEMTGPDLIEAIRSRDDECSGVPAIALTAFSDRAALDRATRAGFDRAEPKPLAPARLVALVREVLDARTR